MINSYLPKLRPDLRVETVHENNQKLTVLYDDLGIASQPIALPYELGDVLLSIDNSSTPEDLLNILNLKSLSYDLSTLIGMLNSLDQMGFMDTARIKLVREDIRSYLNSDIRDSVCAGNSYPDDNFDLKKYLNHILSTKIGKTNKSSIIFAPHIDYRVGMDAHLTYSSAFNSLNTDADLAIMFGTAHYRSSDNFMLTKKNFKTPLGVLETDKEFIRLLGEQLGYEPTIDDLAHRPEHSLELHAVFLQHLFPNKNIKILPILTGSFYNYFNKGINPDSDLRFNEFIDALNSTINLTGRKVIFLSSGDLAHMGRKFEDDFDAEPILDKIRNDDKELIEDLENININSFYNKISSNFDSRKICGLSPFYSTLKTANPSKGDFLEYGQWNERETRSAVSFCSMAFY